MTIRYTGLRLLAFAGAVALAGCGANQQAARSSGALNVLDESGLADIMLTFADPEQAVAYFKKSLAAEPERLDFKRGLATSLMRAKRTDEAAVIYRDMVTKGQASPGDRLAYADALIRGGDFKGAEDQLDATPPTVRNYDRYRLEAMVADHNKAWKRSDSFYETARGLTTRPAPVYNNWGISKLARGDYAGAEAMFQKAITFDEQMFNAKNNLVIARAHQRNYNMPVVPMTGTEKAELMHNMALQALRNGDTQTARGLLEEAIDIHPQHFAAAVEKLDALEKKVTR